MKKQMFSIGILPLLAGLLISTDAISNVNISKDTPFSKKITKSSTEGLKIETVVTGLNVPWGIAFLPNGDMLVTERTGQLRLVHEGKLVAEPIQGLPAIVSKGQGGLLDIKLHPNYVKNGWIYFTYSSPAAEGETGKGSNTALMRAKLVGNTLTEQKVVFKATPNVTTNHHYGGRIAFDRAGYLFLTVGERGQQDEAQKLTTFQGKVVRLHDDGTVPTDNPFVGKEGARPEIYSYGHRNPQGFVINPTTGDLWEHEHGPQGGDEVNILKKGANYGWPAITFGIGYDNAVISSDTARAGMEQPITYYRPSIAPCGMTFVTSKKFPDWKGNLLIGSLKFHYIKRCVIKNNKVVSQETIFENIGRVRDIKEGPDGNIYVAVESTGSIVKISPEK
ncbi:PQQ-dependent sugar dehydrogenase [Arcicella rosea]|uniref:Glucose/arabinose dehydrogenase n=1 Tax=Arcicella rosea TaxID=502909 RepID=A0A841EYF9_9BACT|nr:PQQ-dependent sugar dehydrogenase [Arcicella rosea]MBB6005370.1 glucose/arabinose dehydrogenase [Arcicella rosea]